MGTWSATIKFNGPTKPKFTIAAKFVYGHRQRDETLTHADKNLRHDNGEYTGGFGAYTLQHAGFYNLGSVNEFNPDGQLRNDDLSFASTGLNNAYLGFFIMERLETNSPSLVLQIKVSFLQMRLWRHHINVELVYTITILEIHHVTSH